MNLQNVETQDTYRPEIFQKILETLAGGGLLDITEIPDAIEDVLAGQLLSAKDSAGKLHVVKTAVLYADALVDATTYQVEKGHFFKVGDFIATKEVASCKAYAITAIDTTTNTTHDVITVGTSLGVVMDASDGVYLIQALAEDSTGGAFTVKYPANLILDSQVEIPDDTSDANVNVSAVLRGTVYESRLPIEITDDQKASIGSRIYFR